MKLKQLFLFFQITCVFPVFANWEVQFDNERLIDNQHNREIIKKLKHILPHYHDNYNPVIQFTFHTRTNSKKRWLMLKKEISALKNHHYQIFNSPNDEVLSISFRQIKNNNCPSNIIVHDNELPIKPSGLQVSNSSRLILSQHARIRIKSKPHVTALTYNNNTHKAHYLSINKDYYPIISPKGTTIGIMPNKSKKTFSQLMADMQKVIKNTKYRKKGMSLSPVPLDSVNINSKQQKSKTCIIELDSLDPPPIK